MLLIIALLACSGLTAVHGHSIKMRQSCPPVDGMDALDLDQLMGKWYVIEVLGGVNKCMTMEFEDVSEAKMRVKQESEVSLLKKVNIDQKHSCVGDITKNLDTPSEMQVKWSANPFQMSFIVLDTDYGNFAAIYECQDIFKLLSRVSVAILSRKPTLDDALIQMARDATNTTMVDAGRLASIDHSSCIGEEKPSTADEVTEEYVEFGLSPMLKARKIESLEDMSEEPESESEYEPEQEPESEPGYEKLEDSEGKPELESEPESESESEPEQEPESEPEYESTTPEM